MLTKEYLKDNFIDAYFIDNERKNIEVLTKSEDGEKVIPTIIPFTNPGEEMLEVVKSVISIDDIHERTHEKKKEERKAFEQQVVEIAKKEGINFDALKVDPKHFPSVINAIISDDKNEDHLFAIKLALFEFDKVRDSENEELKGAIRKSESKSEAMMNALKIICGK